MDCAVWVVATRPNQDKGKTHDMDLFRQSDIHIFRFILLVGDKGYQGINELHENSLTPYKKPKGGKLTKEQKDFNRSLSRFRIFIRCVPKPTLSRFFRA